MNKMKKLLSVVLAVVLALSAFSVMGSAQIVQYKTVADLEALDAYSPYGQVTRLSTEERASMIQDFLDNVLPGLGINMGEVFNVLGLSVTIDLTSVDRLCYSLDTVKETKSAFLFSIAAGIVDLGIIETLDMGTWNTDIDREGDSPLNLFTEIFELLSNNTDLVNQVLTEGLDLGIVGGLIKGLDLSSINNIVKNLPGMIKGLVYPKIERWDDTLADIKTYDNSIADESISIEGILNTRVKALFSDDMSITTLKYDANGNMTSEHTKWLASATGSAEPGTPSANSPRCYYQFSSTTPGSVMTVYHIVDNAEAEALAKDNDDTNNVAAYNYFKEAQTFVMSQEVEGSSTYVWKATDEWGNSWSLKWYNDNSPFLPGFSGDKFDLTTMSAGDLLYTFIPVVFKNMAPVVLNGSVKKILAEFFGAQFTRVGSVAEGAEDKANVEALADYDAGVTNIFTMPQGDYLWEWSYYEVVNGNHYYRYLDDIYMANLDAVNNYFDIIDWEFEITGDFMNEFVPANDDDAGTRLLQNVNNFLIKVAEEVLLPSAETDNTLYELNATWTMPTLVKGDNSNLVNNIKKFAQALIGLAPSHIFGTDYATNERCYYELMMSDDNDTVLLGIAAHLVDMIMPSMTLPGKTDIVASGAKVGAVLAAVIREFAAYLAPEYNFDALIYTDYGETDGEKNFVTGVDSEYWFDVCLTMGINVGFEYLRAFADMGEDSTEWNSFVAYSGYGVDGKTYEAGTTQAALNAEWEGMLDYIIDWALDKDYEWTWKMEYMVDTTGLTIDMATAQDPFAKLEKILGDILPVSEILTVNMSDDTTTRDYGTNKMEKFLRHDLILGIVELRWDALINTIQFNGTNKYFRTNNIIDQLAKLLKGVVNSLFKKIGGGSYSFIPNGVDDFDTLATQASIRTLAVNLVGQLNTAYKNGLLDVLAPFLGFLLGWKTDPQVVSDPVVWTEFRDGNDYAFQWTGNGTYPNINDGATKIKFLNNSAGMLETHRNSSVEDHAYDITIKSIDFGTTQNTYTYSFGDGNGVCSPWETLDIIIGGTYSVEESITVTIGYDYVGKGGEAIGGTQYTSVTFLVSNQFEDANIEGRQSGDEKDGKYGIDPFKKYQFTEDIYTTVTTFQPSVWGTNETGGGTSNWHHTNAPDPVTRECDGGAITDSSNAIGMTGYAAEYFEYYQNRDGGWASSFAKDGSTSGKLYYAKDGVTADTEFPYGVYDMGQVGIKYSNDTKVWNIDYIYYNSYGIYDIYLENKDNGYHANQGVSADVYNAYNEAWKLIVYGATYPMMTEANGNAATDYVKTIQPYIPAAIENFEAAKKAYEEALANADANATGGSDASVPSYVDALRQEIDNDFMNGKEINFQDYEFYEYFNYNDVKNAAEDLYRTYIAPEVLDTYHIFRSGIREAELDLVIDAEDNTVKQEAIKASRRVHDQAAIDASIAARDEWKQPINTKLYVDDFTSRLAFYKQFLNEANMEGTEHMYFLNKEIAFIDAQNLNAEDYESITWGRFEAAYNVAKAVQDGTDAHADFNSRIYEVKHELMVRYKELLKKADSLIEAGGTADLLANIEIAEGILAMTMDEIELSDVAIEKGLTKEQALGHLIEGLGYYYQARYTEHDYEVQQGEKAVGDLKYNAHDGSPMMFNLYDESAYEYADNDRPNKQSNQAKVDAANANLEACIAYFATETAEPVLKGIGTGVADAERGYVYGVAAGTTEEGLKTFFEVENGSFKMVANEAGKTNGTGATLSVLDEAGNEVGIFYTLVIFGDVNGDAVVNSTDITELTLYTQNAATLTDVALFAANVNGDSASNSTDITEVSLFTQNAGSLSANPYAA